MVNIGSSAPNFSLPNTKKEPVSLESFRGKTVVLAFFPAAFTGVCEKEMCTFRDSMAALNGLNAAVLGISVDPPFSSGAFAEKNHLNFQILSDYKREVVRSYGVAHDDFAGLSGYTAAKRSVFVLDKAGVVRFSWIAPTPKDEPDYAQVKAEVEKLK